MRVAFAGLLPLLVASSPALAQTPSRSSAEAEGSYRWVVQGTALTGFPDVLGFSVSFSPEAPVFAEAGASLLIPGFFVRAGPRLRLPVPIRPLVRWYRADLLALAGHRVAAVPMIHGGVFQLLTTSAGIRLLPEWSDSGPVWMLTGGAGWMLPRRPSDPYDSRGGGYWPEVRLSLGFSF